MELIKRSDAEVIVGTDRRIGYGYNQSIGDYTSEDSILTGGTLVIILGNILNL